MFKRLTSVTVLIAFFATSVYAPGRAYAAPLLGLPEPGTMVSLSAAYAPAMIKGITLDTKNPFVFDFIIDTGNSGLKLENPLLKEESTKLIKYFLAALTIPEKDLWVNLSPYEKDRTLAQNLSQTEMGRDMLAQDYLLKQITASLIYPEKDLGKNFWDKVYAKSQQMYGTTQIPVNTFNKVWIVADKADVFERNQTAFVMGAHLKVMLEEDYLAKEKNTAAKSNVDQTANIASQIVRDIVIPELEKEVNEGKNFAPLRQMFHSMILASWFKMALKDAVMTQLYGNQNKVGVGVNNDDPAQTQKIYERYLQAYKKGVFNYIKEDVDTLTKEATPKKYFSGGVAALNPAMISRHQDTAAAMTTANSLRGHNLLNVSAAMRSQEPNDHREMDEADLKPNTKLSIADQYYQDLVAALEADLDSGNKTTWQEMLAWDSTRNFIYAMKQNGTSTSVAVSALSNLIEDVEATKGKAKYSRNKTLRPLIVVWNDKAQYQAWLKTPAGKAAVISAAMIGYKGEFADLISVAINGVVQQVGLSRRNIGVIRYEQVKREATKNIRDLRRNIQVQGGNVSINGVSISRESFINLLKGVNIEIGRQALDVSQHLEVLPELKKLFGSVFTSGFSQTRFSNPNSIVYEVTQENRDAFKVLIDDLLYIVQHNSQYGGIYFDADLVLKTVEKLRGNIKHEFFAIPKGQLIDNYLPLGHRFTRDEHDVIVGVVAPYLRAQGIRIKPYLELYTGDPEEDPESSITSEYVTVLGAREAWSINTNDSLDLLRKRIYALLDRFLVDNGGIQPEMKRFSDVAPVANAAMVGVTDDPGLTTFITSNSFFNFTMKRADFITSQTEALKLIPGEIRKKLVDITRNIQESSKVDAPRKGIAVFSRVKPQYGYTEDQVKRDIESMMNLITFIGDIYKEMGNGDVQGLTAEGQANMVTEGYHNHVHNLNVTLANLLIASGKGLIKTREDLIRAVLGGIFHDFHIRAAYGPDGKTRTPALVDETIRQLGYLLGVPGYEEYQPAPGSNSKLQEFLSSHENLKETFRLKMMELLGVAIPAGLYDQLNGVLALDQLALVKTGETTMIIRRTVEEVSKLNNVYQEKLQAIFPDIVALIRRTDFPSNVAPIPPVFMAYKGKLEALRDAYEASMEEGIKDENIDAILENMRINIVAWVSEIDASDKTEAQKKQAVAWLVRNQEIESNYLNSLKGVLDSKKRLAVHQMAQGLEIGDQSVSLWLATPQLATKITEGLKREVPIVSVLGNYFFFYMPQLLKPKVLSYIEALPIQERNKFLTNLEYFAAYATNYIQTIKSLTVVEAQPGIMANKEYKSFADTPRLDAIRDVVEKQRAMGNEVLVGAAAAELLKNPVIGLLESSLKDWDRRKLWVYNKLGVYWSAGQDNPLPVRMSMEDVVDAFHEGDYMGGTLSARDIAYVLGIAEAERLSNGAFSRELARYRSYIDGKESGVDLRIDLFNTIMATLQESRRINHTAKIKALGQDMSVGELPLETRLQMVDLVAQVLNDIKLTNQREVQLVLDEGQGSANRTVLATHITFKGKNESMYFLDLFHMPAAEGEDSPLMGRFMQEGARVYIGQVIGGRDGLEDFFKKIRRALIHDVGKPYQEQLFHSTFWDLENYLIGPDNAEDGPGALLIENEEVSLENANLSVQGGSAAMTAQYDLDLWRANANEQVLVEIADAVATSVISGRVQDASAETGVVEAKAVRSAREKYKGQFEQLKADLLEYLQGELPGLKEIRGAQNRRFLRSDVERIVVNNNPRLTTSDEIRKAAEEYARGRGEVLVDTYAELAQPEFRGSDLQQIFDIAWLKARFGLENELHDLLDKGGLLNLRNIPLRSKGQFLEGEAKDSVIAASTLLFERWELVDKKERMERDMQTYPLSGGEQISSAFLNDYSGIIEGINLKGEQLPRSAAMTGQKSLRKILSDIEMTMTSASGFNVKVKVKAKPAGYGNSGFSLSLDDKDLQMQVPLGRADTIGVSGPFLIISHELQSTGVVNQFLEVFYVENVNSSKRVDWNNIEVSMLEYGVEVRQQFTDMRFAFTQEGNVQIGYGSSNKILGTIDLTRLEKIVKTFGIGGRITLKLDSDTNPVEVKVNEIPFMSLQDGKTTTIYKCLILSGSRAGETILVQRNSLGDMVELREKKASANAAMTATRVKFSEDEIGSEGHLREDVLRAFALLKEIIKLNNVEVEKDAWSFPYYPKVSALESDKEMEIDYIISLILIEIEKEMKDPQFDDLYSMGDSRDNIRYRLPYDDNKGDQGGNNRRRIEALIKTMRQLIIAKEERLLSWKDENPEGDAAMSPGGIDLDANKMGMKVSKEGAGVDITFDPSLVERMKRDGFNGFIPVIINITPVTNILPLLGLAPRKEEEEKLAGV